MTAAGFSAPLENRRWLTDTVVELALSRPAGFQFLPGQRIRIRQGPLERDYSLASAPQDPALRLLVRVFPHGRLSPHLSALSIGTEISFDGPLGYFVFQPSDRTPVFVATGTGVAPFVSMSRAGIGGFICLHGARTEAGLFYGKALAGQADRYVPCLSDAGASAGEGFKGRVTDYLSRMLAEGAYDFYLCGRQAMVHDAIAIIDERFFGAHIHSEVFY